MFTLLVIRHPGHTYSAPTRTPRNRAALAGIVVVSRRSAISERFSYQFGDLSTSFMFRTRSSIMAANDIDSSARGAVARRACQGPEWITAINAHCTYYV
ncbi:hypothetical protein Y032_0011g1429 [Ancylostoma ceylanicum]|uniref:Uncharacterized protein n=1 Tax=Ancylostoma ceylanicum TaxID=53326 RepID=A0A016VEK5_9BILA|nr:hypothetical protein Y032_0011g1429 [Ancylostoma ceylanicum]